LAEKVTMLEALPRKALDLAPQMVAIAADAKGIAPRSTRCQESLPPRCSDELDHYKRMVQPRPPK
jgi:hypothetical protein